RKSSIDFEEGRDFWAFQKPQKVEPPKVQDQRWNRSGIDRFVKTKLEESGLKPVAKADEERLLRRDYINLVGIPPTEPQVQAYLADRSPKKREKLIDRLLASPQFGERWGRHWLDVARFAESNGRERNFLFPHAWRYRNYVIDSFNQDKPFSRFVQEQIAGDQLAPMKNQDAVEAKVGTGFLAIGPKLLNERSKEVFAMDMVDEQIDVICRSTMAMTVACARCHDHKFDPISTDDYYALAGILRSTQTLFGRGGGGSRQATPLMSISDDPAREKKVKQEHAQEIKKLTASLNEIKKQITNRNKAVAAANNAAKNKKTGNSKANEDKGQAKADRTKAKENAKKLADLKRRQRLLQQKLNQLRQSGPEGVESAMGVSDGPCVDCNVLIRGEVTAKGKKIPRGFLTVLGEQERQEIVDREKSGRLEFANWLVSPDNPLTARVTVNRIWRHLFGEGIVRTVDNFGESGERPTHPELLDFLAVRLVENDWSFKKMIREIMLSETYQLGGDYERSNYAADPDNRLLWRMNSRRLDAEVLRDSILLSAGELDLTRPESSVVAKYKSTQGIGRGVTEDAFDIEMTQRSVYLPVVRNAVPEALRVFDFAEPSILIGDRMVTTVPTQALFMMNSRFVIEQSKKLAERLSRAGEARSEQIVAAYQSVITRTPSADELQRGSRFVESTRQKLIDKNTKEAEAEQLALAAFCQALYASGEFRILN
ncbi:MAG: DUF1549 and DUF1553 domain-containing protein, partial [Planctomycetota bacterium]|nr:DUF1549 and DUF1553 domain-containing protein [Planctomycetota bacterium]